MPANTDIVNLLLEPLSAKQKKAIVQRCEPVELKYGAILAEERQRIRYVYFPVDAFISSLITNPVKTTMEVGLVGNEGMLGISLILGVAQAPLRARVQGPGIALRMSARDFRDALDTYPEFRKRLSGYQYVVMEQFAQMAACSLFHNVNQRLCRWLLMSQDRAHKQHFKLTQALMSRMLGVRRSAVSTAASKLKRQGLIDYSRGKLSIYDREGIKEVACPCYGAAISAYQRILGGSAP